MLNSKKSVGIIFFPAFDWAISPSHPEREERLLYTQDQIKEEGLFDFKNIKEFKPLIASTTQINRAHVCIPNVESQTTVSHRISAGGALKAAKIIMDKTVEINNKEFNICIESGNNFGINSVYIFNGKMSEQSMKYDVTLKSCVSEASPSETDRVIGPKLPCASGLHSTRPASLSVMPSGALDML